MLSIGKIGAGQASPTYYVDQVAAGREDYYTGAGEAQGQWDGSQAASDGRTGTVDPDDFLGMLAAKPDSQQSILGFDLTFSAPKSVSVLYGIGDSQLSRQVRDAHDHAVTEALGYLEREATWTRRGKGGRDVLQGDGLTAALFRHRSSRAGDPQLHTHAVIANETVANGRTTTLYGRALYAHAKTAGYLYQAALRAQLTETVGVAWEPVHKGTAEITGMAPDVLKHFSQRSAEIAEHLDQHGGTGRRAREQATLATRRVKDRDVPADRLHQDWHARAQEHGLGQNELDALLDRRAPGPAIGPDLGRHAEHLASPVGLTRQASTFDRRDVLRAWASAHREGASAERLEQITNRWLNETQTVRVSQGARSPTTGARYSTPEMLTSEQDLLTGATARRGTGVAMVTPATQARGLASDPELSPEQVIAVRAITGSGHGVEVLRAPAGTGKTRVLGTARHAWDANGQRTLGCGLSARAALELEAESGIDSTTIAALLKDLDRGRPLGDNAVLVVDEAGMVGTRDLHRLHRHTEHAGAKLLLVGDDHQLPEIDAGGSFAELARRLDAATLTEVRRQQHPWDRDALAALRAGETDRWADAYRQHGRIVTAATATQSRDRLVADWWQTARRPDSDAVMLAHRRTDVHDLNQRARALMHRDGRLTGEEVTIADRGYAIGDRVLARRNDRQLGVINGARGTVSDVDPEACTVEVQFDHNNPVTVDGQYLADGHLHHGYAMTAHAAQGQTVDHAYILGTDDLYREWGYTALTRHRTEARFYAVSTGSVERCLPGLEPDNDPLNQTVDRVLGQSRRQHLASRDANPRDLEQARERLRDPAPAVVERIGERPMSPLDRDTWTRAAVRLLHRSPEIGDAATPDLTPSEMYDLGP